MTQREAKQKLEQASRLIFEVESQFTEQAFPRVHGYRARIALATFHNSLDLKFENRNKPLTP